MKREHKLTGAAVANTIPTAPTTAPIVLLTVQEVAERLKIPVSSVYEKTRWRRAATATPPLPCRKVGRYIRVIASELDAWLISLPQSAHAAKRRYTQRKQAA
jgi:excisionase family DNA binding protein